MGRVRREGDFWMKSLRLGPRQAGRQAHIAMHPAPLAHTSSPSSEWKQD